MVEHICFNPGRNSGFCMQETFGKWLERIRTARGMSIRSLASKAGISHATISNIEADKVGASGKMVKSLADALEVDAAEAFRVWSADAAQQQGVEIERVSDEIEYIVNLDELTPEGHSDYDDLPTTARETARAAATAAARNTYKTVADAIREARRDSPGTVTGAGPVEKDERPAN